ncbi:hypothetical protein [Streptomyces sp. NPDC058653]|uniref:hypothetical protein n=1 Tax=Streptomyces sp. NPDC058653 TaxID=3346576 RepID=UPI00365B8C53
MTLLAPGSTTLGLTPVCWVLKPKTAIRCVRIGANHDGDHANVYAGKGGVTWPRTTADRR